MYKIRARMNKKAVAISIAVFVISVGVLLFLSINTYNKTKNEVNQIIIFSDYMEDLKIKQLQLDYHLDQIFERAVKDFKPEQGKNVFINNFRDELNALRINGGDILKGFEMIDGQLVDENVELNDNLLALELNLTLEIIKKITADDNLYARYQYKKRFEKVFK